MNKLFLVLALASVTTTATAKPGYDSPIPVRYEYVYTIAEKGFCRKLGQYFDSRPNGANEQEVEEKFLAAQRAFRLTDSEVTVLINSCLSYQQGWNDRNNQ